MTMKYVAAAVLGLACISAAEAPENYSVYAGPQVTADPIILDVYDQALVKCTAEASTPPRGTTFTSSLYYNAALRSCLSRHGFIDNGAHAYPTNRLF